MANFLRANEREIRRIARQDVVRY